MRSMRTCRTLIKNMFKLLHTSDWHLGQQLFNVQRLDDEAEMLEQITEIAEREQPNALVVSGDIFHSPLPSAAAQKLFNKAMLRLRRVCPGTTIVVIAGNHDGTLRLEAWEEPWSELGIRLISTVKVQRTDGHVVADYDAHIVEVREGLRPDGKLLGLIGGVPFTYPQNYPHVSETEATESEETEGGSDKSLAERRKNARQSAYFKGLTERIAARNEMDVPVVLMAHLALEGSKLSEEEERWIGNVQCLPVSALGGGYDYLALGHIHKPQSLNAQGNVRYAGAPLAVNFGETSSHGVTLVEIDAQKNCRVEEIALSPSHPLITWPNEAVTLEEALAHIDALAERNAYVRLHVKTPLPTNSMSLATTKLEEIGCRFCTFLTEATGQGMSDIALRNTQQLTRFDLQQATPISIARMYLEGKDMELTEEMEQMLNECLEQVKQEEQEK